MIRKIISKGVLIVLFVTYMLACKTDEVVMDTTSISTLNCSSAAFSATATENNAYTGTATVPYTGGNGVGYTAGSAVSSTGVTGLTATLTSGTLASGAENLTYNNHGYSYFCWYGRFCVKHGRTDLFAESNRFNRLHK